MRNIRFRHVKGFFVLVSAFLTITGSTTAYFTTTVNANGNEIIAGTVSLAMDTTSSHEFINDPIWNTHAYNVAFDNNGVTESVDSFEVWSEALPGDSFAYYLGVRNTSTTDLKFKFRPVGEWNNLRNDPLCVADPASVRFENLKIFGTGTDCSSNNECHNIKEGLANLSSSWTYRPNTTANNFIQSFENTGTGFVFLYGTSDGLSTGTNIVLAPSEFVVYKMDMKLDDEVVDDCYQGATYDWGVELKGYQTASPWTP